MDVQIAVGDNNTYDKNGGTNYGDTTWALWMTIAT